MAPYIDDALLDRLENNIAETGAVAKLEWHAGHSTLMPTVRMTSDQ